MADGYWYHGNGKIGGEFHPTKPNDEEHYGKYFKVKHGHWEHKIKRWANSTDIYVSNICSLCKEESYGMYHYCPNCGAKMDERIEDEL